MMNVAASIKELAKSYSTNLEEKIKERYLEMEGDNTDHYMLYRILGISEKKGKLIDEYQNAGRYLYKYAGSFLEEASILCFEHSDQTAQRKVKIKNVISQRPRPLKLTTCWVTVLTK